MKMKKTAFISLLTAGLVTLAGCSSPPREIILKPTETEASTTISTVVTTTTAAVTTTVLTTTALTTTTTVTTTETTTEPEPETTETRYEDIPESTPEEEPETPADDYPPYDSEFYENDLFIGDSIYTGLTLFGYMENEQVFAKIGLNPESASYTEIDGETAPDKAKRLAPKRIYIMLGTNGLAYMGNNYMANCMRDFIGSLREASPDSEIYVISIPPVTKVHDMQGNETMELVNGYNSLLEAMCGETGTVYLDLCSKLKNSEGFFSSAYAEADGLHFLGAAYTRMLRFIEATISE